MSITERLEESIVTAIQARDRFLEAKDLVNFQATNETLTALENTRDKMEEAK